MIAVLVVTTTDLAFAFRHHRAHPLATAIRDLLSENGASLHPLVTTPDGDNLSKYFRLQVADGVRDSLVKELRKLPGVAGTSVRDPSVKIIVDGRSL